MKACSNIDMAKLIKETMKEQTTIVRSQDKTHIFEFTKDYSFEGESAIVITLSSESDNTTSVFDRTKYFTFTNLTNIGISKITMFSLFTKINGKFKSNSYTDEDIQNSLQYLKKLLELDYSYVVIAIGSSHSSDNKVKEAKRKLYELLIPFSQQNKVVKIQDNMELYITDEITTLHPLFCGNYLSLRWKLVPFDIQKAITNLDNAEKRAMEMKKKAQQKRSEASFDDVCTK